MTTESITTNVPIVYTVTTVCPLCHESITFNQAGVTVCPHCGMSFVVNQQLPQWTPGPSEVKG